MHKLTQAFRHIASLPIILLVLLNLAIGLLTFRDYGLSWDEPLFYDYADSIRLAYTPQAFSPTFDFEQVYGPSATDHKYYGPAYLLAAQPVQQAVMALFGADRASAWHLVNFLTFQIGLLFFYLLIRRWFDPWPAAAASAFFACQPVMWGHAFINPKDMPFMVFFLAVLTLGFWMVDSFSKQENLTTHRPGVPSGESKKRFSPWPSAARTGQWTLCSLWLNLFRFVQVRVLGLVFLAGIVLGATAAVRVIGPLAGVAIFVYFISQKNWRAFPAFLTYGIIAILVMFAAWPFLWADPLNRLTEVLKHMSNNPTELAVLFMGQIFRANEMPRIYLPRLFTLTLTEPTWILFLIGLVLAIRSFFTKKLDWRAPLIMLGIFVFMLAYLLYNKPSVYDGYRHFLFLLPPVFVFVGFAFQWIWEKLQKLSRYLPSLALLLLLPGIFGIIHLHPYEYAYYNQFAGGVTGAYRTYETEYWLTCYKESLEWIRTNQPGKTIHIQREFPLAAYYGAGLTLKDLGQELETDIQPGDLLLFSTRASLDIRSIYRKLPVVHAIGRDGAEFCLIKQKE